MSDLLHLYNLSMGVLSVAGLVYLVYSQQFVLGYRRFLYPVVAGVFVFSVGGPLADLFLRELVHLVHGLAALLVSTGLYTLVHDDFRTDEWPERVLREPSELRHPADWMVPMDDEILELFHSAHLVLTPSIIAYNIDRSREEVNRRLTELTEHDLVDRVGRGKYRITEFGEQYLRGGEFTNESVMGRLQSKLIHR